MAVDSPLAGITVTQWTSREAAGVCGTLLAQLGATVIAIEPEDDAKELAALRAPLMAGKLSLSIDPGSAQDSALLTKLTECSDVVITSSDIDGARAMAAGMTSANIICDITAFGSSGPLAGWAFSEAEIQAVAGLAHTTGPKDGAPLITGVPVVGYVTGTYAAAAVLAALRTKRHHGFGQHIEIAMFDCAFLSLNSFLGGVLTGLVKDRSRMGNGHPTVPAWNLYRTTDGWVQICAGNQTQWERLCACIGRPDLAARLTTVEQRMASLAEIDATVEDWTRTLSASACVERLYSAGIAAGEIAPIVDFPREANLDFRTMIRTVKDARSGRETFVPASPIALRGSPPLSPTSVPTIGADRAPVKAIATRMLEPQGKAGTVQAKRPLEGVRVVEIGQYTTAPMCARNLALLGADVIKVERLSGDESRSYEPRLGNRSEAYCLNNGNKRSIAVDLRSADGIELVRSLLQNADVLVENNKPGTLAKFGLTNEDIANINPRLVHCAISGFGMESRYSARPGFDTVIQAVSGFMTAVNPKGMPMKSGISTSDLMGAEMGIVAILAALEYRERFGKGQFIDLSMQDISCWLTAPAWNNGLTQYVAPNLIACADGFVMSEDERASTLANSNAYQGMTRAAALAHLEGLGIRAVAVATLREAVDSPQTKARDLWRLEPSEGRNWPVLAGPVRLQGMPATQPRLAPELGQDRDSILAELGRAAAR